MIVEEATTEPAALVLLALVLDSADEAAAAVREAEAEEELLPVVEALLDELEKMLRYPICR